MISEAPHPEEYSRVSDPERFRPIQVEAKRVIAELVREFDIDVRPAPPVHGVEVNSVVDSYLLVPSSPGSAPIHISFTTFPGVIAKFGVGTVSGFPRCGCDACRETADGEINRFTDMLESVTTGRFLERVSGVIRKRFESEFWSDGGTRAEKEVLGKNDPRHQLRRRRYRWKPWTRRAIVSVDFK